MIPTISLKRFWAMLLFIIWFFLTLLQLEGNTYEDHLSFFYTAIEQSRTEQGIWISNPAFIVFTEKKAQELIYYPLYNTEKIKELKEKTREAKLILLNTCDILPCPPEDISCLEMHEEFLQQLKFEFVLSAQHQMNGCFYYVFETDNL